MYSKLRATIKEKGYKHKQVAEKIFISPACFSERMIGKIDFTLDEAIRIKKILGVDTPIEELFEEA